MRRLIPITCLAAALLAPSAASAQKLAVDPDGDIEDYDTEAEQYSRFWESAMAPGSATYGDLVAQAASIIEHDLGADDARTVLRDAIARRPDAPLAHFWLGILERKEKNFAACAASLSRTLEIDPDFAPPPGPLPSKEWAIELELGLCLARGGKLSAAARRLTRITTRHPSCAENRRDPDCTTWEVPWRLGETLMALGRLEEAIAQLEVARSMTSLLEVRYTLAVALERNEQLFEAKKQLDSIVGQDVHLASLTAPTRLYIPTADRFYYLGLASEIRDDRARTAVYFRGYLAAAPRSPWVSRARAHLAEATRPAIGAGAELRGVHLSRPRVLRALAEAGPELERCVAAVPDQIFEVTISLEIAGRRQIKRSVKASWFNLLEKQTERAAIEAASGCVRHVAEGIELPRPEGPSGAGATVTFDVFARQPARP